MKKIPTMHVGNRQLAAHLARLRLHTHTTEARGTGRAAPRPAISAAKQEHLAHVTELNKCVKHSRAGTCNMAPFAAFHNSSHALRGHTFAVCHHARTQRHLLPLACRGVQASAVRLIRSRRSAMHLSDAYHSKLVMATTVNQPADQSNPPQLNARHCHVSVAARSRPCWAR